MSGRSLRIGSPSTAGFTLIELPIVVAMLAILAVVAIPAIMKNARKAHDDAAIGAIRTLVTAQSLYKDHDPDRNGLDDYAPTLDVLAETDPEIATLLDPDPRHPPDSAAATSLAGSSVLHCCSQGYYFAILGTEPPPAAAFRVVAIPLSPATGERTFAAYESGLVLAAIGHVPVSGDEIIDPGAGSGSACGAGCDGSPPLAIPTQADLDARDEALRARTRTLILTLNRNASGAGIPEAETRLSDPAFQPAVLAGIDLAGDGVSADDVTQANLLQLARTLTPPSEPPPPTVLDDATASALLSSYQSDLAALMDLALYAPHPSASAADLTGDPLAFLASWIALPSFGAAGGAVLALGIALTGVAWLRAASRIRAT